MIIATVGRAAASCGRLSEAEAASQRASDAGEDDRNG